MTARTDLMAQNEPTPDMSRPFWNARPCNIWHKPVGTREYFDEVEQRKHFVEPHIPEFAQFDYWAGKRVLEVGCGVGTAAVNFARAGADYTGPAATPAKGPLRGPQRPDCLITGPQPGYSVTTTRTSGGVAERTSIRNSKRPNTYTKTRRP
jgi:hypothetical protein